VTQILSFTKDSQDLRLTILKRDSGDSCLMKRYTILETFVRCVALADKEYRKIQDEIDERQDVTYIIQELYLESQ
jgi:hypothetical protein